MRPQTSFIFDLDGTLTDSVYQNVAAWKEALDSEGIPLAMWRIHRKIGMSGGLMLKTLLNRPGFSRHSQGSLRNAFQTLPVTA
ncbi:HAD family hydrolase, partial [Pseudomonas fluorescens]